MNHQNRELRMYTTGQPTMDGNQVKITRMIGTPELDALDPFLLLDVFESNEGDDYVGGFPEHPHRGFETVTYLLAGRMRHKDNAGHEGVIEPGGVQWMTAGRGIVHSEMPEQTDGWLQGVQIWINLPANEKMRAPSYQEFPADTLAIERQPNGTVVRVIAGTTDNGTTGPIISHSVKPGFFDISLPDGEIFRQSLPDTDNALLYVISGQLKVGNDLRPLAARRTGILSSGNQISVQASGDSRFLLLSASPLREPIARGGPFVMNTKQEILQAFADYQNNRF